MWADPGVPSLATASIPSFVWGVFGLKPSTRPPRAAGAPHRPAPPAAGQRKDISAAFNANVHGARGLFASMVLVYHVVNSRLPTFAVLDHGWTLLALRSLEHGVELFFGISGIVIYGALRRTRGPGVFLLERATRIYPVLWASVLVIAALGTLSDFEGRRVSNLGVLLANLLAAPPVIPGQLIHPAAWSLSYELTFYALCATAFALRRYVGRWTAWPVGLVAGLLLVSHVRALLMPVGLGLAFIAARRPALLRPFGGAGLALIGFLISWEGVCQLSGGDIMDAPLTLFAKGWAPVLVAIAVAAAILMFASLLTGAGFLCAVLRGPVLQTLGTWSFSLYLWHPIVMALVKHLMLMAHAPERFGPWSQAAFLLLSLPPSLAVAWASQATLERRVTAWLRKRLEGKAAGPLEPVTSSHRLAASAK